MPLNVRKKYARNALVDPVEAPNAIRVQSLVEVGQAGKFEVLGGDDAQALLEKGRVAFLLTRAIISVCMGDRAKKDQL